MKSSTKATKVSVNTTSVPAAPVTEDKVNKIVIAATIVLAAFASYADNVARARVAGEDVAKLESPRQIAIGQIRAQLFPKDESKTACNTYYQLGLGRALEQLSADGQAALEKGKQVYTVFKLHKTKGVTQVSQTILATSKAKAEAMVRLYQMDGYEAGVIAKNTPKAAKAA